MRPPILFLINLPKMANRQNAVKFTATTPAPAGMEYTKEMKIPVKKHTTDNMADETTTAKKLLHTRMEVSAGNIIRLEMSMAPIKRIPITMVSAVSTAMSVLYLPAFTPVALEKLSSNVTAKILL
jgi:hypothetical protein